MFKLSVTEDVKAACTMFFYLYGTEISDTYIESFLLERFKTHDIEAAYNLGLITKDEVCSFIFSNLYTKFIIGAKLNKEPSEQEFDRVRCAFSQALFK